MSGLSSSMIVSRRSPRRGATRDHSTDVGTNKAQVKAMMWHPPTRAVTPVLSPVVSHRAPGADAPEVALVVHQVGENGFRAADLSHNSSHNQGNTRRYDG